MSKCEHGDKITIFCATDSCAWKEAAGCPLCIKRYHNHIGPTIFLNEEDITVIVKKYNVEQSIKPKCRLLQEAIFNYLNLFKTELTNSIDAVCKNIINQIGYPYLSNTNTLPAYKRLKNKQYRKLMSKQFKLLYDQSLKITEKDLIREQSKNYMSQTKLALEVLNNMEAIIKNYQAAIKSTCPTFVHDVSPISKINQIIKSLYAETLKGNTKAKENENNKPTEAIKPRLSSLILNKDTTTENKNDSKPEKQKNDKSNDLSNNRTTNTPFTHMRDVSLDKKMGKGAPQGEKQKIPEKNRDNAQSQPKDKNKSQRQIALPPNNTIKIQTLKLELNNKQAEINEKKRILIDMMKSKQPKVTFDKQYHQTGIKKDIVANQVKSVNPKSKKDAEIDCLQEQKSCNECIDFDEDISKIESAVKNYAFTKLPLEQTSVIFKKFQDQQQVQKKLIVVPKDAQSKLSEIDSPIYRKKNILSKIEQSKLKEYGIDKEDKSTDSNIANAYWSKPNQLVRKQEVLELKDNEQKSLALLLKSLNLKAEEAVVYLESAFKYADNNLSVAEYLTYIYLQLNRPKDCLIVCNTMLEKIRNSRQSEQLSVILMNNKCAAFNLMGRYSESIRILEDCLKYKEKDSLYKNLGDAYFSLSIYEKAIYNYEKALILNQNYDEVHYNMAVCLYIQQNYHNAKLSIRNALCHQPKNDHYLSLSTNIQNKLLHF